MLSETFAPVGAALADQRGLPELPIARIAHPVGAATTAGVEAKADAAFAAIVAGFTNPIAPLHNGRANGAAIVGAPDGPAEAIEFFFDAGWTDGLPVVPPLPELVAAAVAATGRDADSLVAVLPPLLGQATVSKIAANAVMAGCLPEYLPVVIAGIEALADPAYGLYHRQVTTHAGAPLMIVNGPIAQRLAINSRTGVSARGWRANATIGRAIRLILMNLGGAIPGVTDMSQHGHPGKFTYCIAEDEETNPWEPLHVERGFRAEQSVVTMVNAEAPHSMTDNFATHAREILTTCASTLAALGSNNLYSQGEPVLALGPEHTAYIAADGWSKSDVKLFIYDKARQPWHLVSGRGKSLGPKFPKWLDRPEPDDMVPILSHPDELIVMCCGGAGGKSMGIPTAGRMSRAVSRAIVDPEEANVVDETNATRRIAEWASDLTYEALPPEVADLARTLVLDFMRAAVIGARTPWGSAIRHAARELGGAPTSTVLVFGDRIDAARAAFVNGCFGHAADIDDTHVGSMFHPGAVIIPAAFAVAELCGSSGRETLAAIVAGYEVAIRISLAVQPSHFKRGFQATGTVGVFGSAVAAAKLLGSDRERLTGTLGTAGSMAGGLAQFYYSGSSVKRIHAGRAAEAGVLAALLAKAGVEGPADVLEGQAGFAHAYADAFATERLFDGLGDRYKLGEITLKPHATSARVQASVEAVHELASRGPIDPADVVSIDAAIPSVIVGRLTQGDPPDCSAAQMSLPFTVALALVLAHERGSDLPLSVDDYQARLSDREVRRIALATQCRVDPEIEAMTTDEVVPARITLRLRDGSERVASVDRALGAPGRPLGIEAAGRLFRAAGADFLAPASLDAVVAAVHRLPATGSAREIAESFARIPAGSAR